MLKRIKEFLFKTIRSNYLPETHFNYQYKKCNHEWIITGAGFTVCRKCKEMS